AWRIHVGSTIVVAGSLHLRVAGVAVEPDNVAFPLVGQPRVYVDYDVARLLGGGRPGATNELLLWTHDPSRLDVTLAQAREASFGLRSLEFLTRRGIHVEIGQAAGIVIALLVAFSTIALAAAGVMLAASAASEVQRRLEAIGILRVVARPLRTATTATVLAVSAALALLILSIASLLGRLQTEPQAIGRSYQLTIDAGVSKLPAIQRLPDVVAVAPRYETWATD